MLKDSLTASTETAGLAPIIGRLDSPSRAPLRRAPEAWSEDTFVAIVSLTTAFDINEFWSAESVANLLSNATTYRYQTASGRFIELIGTCDPGTGTPVSGTVTQIRAYADASFTPLVGAITGLTYTFVVGAYVGTPAVALTGIDAMNGSTSNDTLSGIEQVRGSAFDGNTLRGRAGNDVIDGWDGNDTVDDIADFDFFS